MPPFRWNPLRGPPGVHPKTWINAVAEALEKSHLSGPSVADILIETPDKKFEDFGFYDGKVEQYSNFFDATEELIVTNGSTTTPERNRGESPAPPAGSAQTLWPAEP